MMKIRIFILSLLLWYSGYSQVKTFSAVNVIDSFALGGSAYMDTIINISQYSGNLTADTLTANHLHLPNDTITGTTDTINVSQLYEFLTNTWERNGANLYPVGYTRVGIGTNTPNDIFQVQDRITFNNNYLGTYIGYNTGTPNDYRNTFVGYNTGYNVDYADNTAIGAMAMYNSIHVRDNVVIGSSAGFSNAGNANVLIGYKSGYKNTGNNIIAIGYQAGYKNLGTNNIFNGYKAGYNNASGSSNVFTGAYSGFSNTSGNSNTFYGAGSGENNTNGYGNVFIGAASGNLNTTGSDNVFFGTEAGFANNAGKYNVYIGSKAGFNNTAGSQNIFIGSNAGYNETGNNRLYIENSDSSTPLIYGNFEFDSLKINGSLNVTGSIISENSKSVISNYTISYSDFRLVVVATSNDVNLTLPMRSSLAGLPYHEIEIIPITANGYKVRVQCQEGDSFPTGNTWIDLPGQKKFFSIGLHEHGFNLRTSLTVDASYYIEHLDATDFSDPVMIKWKEEQRNTQNQIISWDTGSKITVNTSGTYEVSAMFTFDSNGGYTWNAEAVLYVNGSPVPNTSLRTGNYGGEDGGMTGIPTLIELKAGDYIEVQIDNDNLSGELLYATFNIKLEL